MKVAHLDTPTGAPCCAPSSATPSSPPPSWRHPSSRPPFSALAQDSDKDDEPPLPLAVDRTIAIDMTEGSWMSPGR